ncbi:hypothetical protein [Rhodococcus sp. T7]|uniref:hypothetical protein n=1 Tax=Rhodococcus sp. T7 TaxID=627444 RepID=UPI001359A9F7|nr:hypothetical protein [Rhodococcus sp. T7]KAF0959802.1 hypothetical protein MLGJGCBP_07138 [Rhodococcus sp. T7]
MRKSTITEHWSRQLGKKVYRIKVEGIEKALMFNAEELTALQDNIHQALGGASSVSTITK